MRSSENERLKAVIRSVLQERADSSYSGNILAAARQAHEDLAGVMVPLIGDVGLRALSARAVHLAQRDFPGAPASEPVANDGASDAIDAWLQQVEPGRALEAASMMLSELGGLLGTFIGESLTNRLLRKAWPDVFPVPESEETQS